MKFINLIRTIKNSYCYNKILYLDVKKYKKYYSTSCYCAGNGMQEARDIVVFCHVVEKGMSHKNIKPLFAYDKVLSISSLLKRYIEKGGKDTFIIQMAVSTIEKYNELNKSIGVMPDKLIELSGEFDNVKRINVGVQQLKESDYFSNIGSPFKEFSSSRHSVRLYDTRSDEIDLLDLKTCITTAQSAPSACNRQSVRVKIIQDRQLIQRVCEIQGGCKGFGENSGVLIILTVDISLYDPNERRIPMLDCGLFLMNLTYALYEQKFASCILNGSFTISREKQIRELIAIPEGEMIAAVVSVSKIPKNEEILVANSCKRVIDDIITVI